MTGKLLSIQGEKSKKKDKSSSAECRAFRHKFDGHVFQETHGKQKVWVAYLECGGCGTIRVDIMVPKSCELISRMYLHSEEYDTQLTVAEAKKIVYKSMLQPAGIQSPLRRKQA